jgi:hypothetical protein
MAVLLSTWQGRKKKRIAGEVTLFSCSDHCKLLCIWSVSSVVSDAVDVQQSDESLPSFASQQLN